MNTLRFRLQRLSEALYKRGLTDQGPCPYTGEHYVHEAVNDAQRIVDMANARDPLEDRALCRRACDAAQRHLGPIFTSFEYPRLYESRNGHLLLDIPVKTHRAPGGCYEDDCDGTEWPSEDQDQAAARVATELGLPPPKYEVCEKGWGDYMYEVARV